MCPTEITSDTVEFSYIYFNTKWHVRPTQPKYLLQLLLGAQVVGVSTLLLAAVNSTGVQTGIAPEKRGQT